MTLASLLRRARSYVARGWCQGANAKDGNSTSVPHDSANAVSWCVIGAERRASLDLLGTDRRFVDTGSCDACALLAAVAGCEDTAEWNDAPGRTQEEVLEAYDAAIAIAEGRVP